MKYDEYKPWLEYSVSKDAAFCLVCYLFNIEYGDHRGGHDSFTGEGFRCWNGLMAEVSEFCERFEIDVPNMDAFC